MSSENSTVSRVNTSNNTREQPPRETEVAQGMSSRCNMCDIGWLCGTLHKPTCDGHLQFWVHAMQTPWCVTEKWHGVTPSDIASCVDVRNCGCQESRNHGSGTEADRCTTPRTNRVVYCLRVVSFMHHVASGSVLGFGLQGHMLASCQVTALDWGRKQAPAFLAVHFLHQPKRVSGGPHQ